ncbi:hypothetical protein [Streptomyces sp. KR55]|uniref:beta-xylosidase family glycoside hydrolase n=1 Tax=Streptomyces sp. KR55 TaxID=3457425 RepID=UPI003FD3E9D6
MPLPHRPAAQRRGLSGRSRGAAGPQCRARRASVLQDARTGPDTLSFGFEGPDSAFTALGTLDGHHLSAEVADGFTGRVNGIYAAEGTAHFDWFDHEPVAR